MWTLPHPPPDAARFARAAGLLAMLASATTAAAAEPEGPGVEALRQFREGRPPRNIVQNRFFLKKDRFELAPMFGYSPNNSFARRYVASLGFGYHFTEALSVQGIFSYSPDLGEGDLKALTPVLVQRAAESGNEGFQQPLDKFGLSATFGVQWTPFYGKINLLGETVLNFDFYGFLGVGMLATSQYVAKYDADTVEAAEDAGICCTPQDIVILEQQAAFKPYVAPVIGLGGDFFLSQSVALKLDTRFSLYVADKPDYDPTDDTAPSGKRVVNSFVASGGVAIFFPKMKPRFDNF